MKDNKKKNIGKIIAIACVIFVVLIYLLTDVFGIDDGIIYEIGMLLDIRILPIVTLLSPIIFFVLFFIKKKKIYLILGIVDIAFLLLVLLPTAIKIIEDDNCAGCELKERNK